MAREPAHPRAGASAARRASSQLRVRVTSALAARLSPERTRRATLLERMTVRRLSWDRIVLANRYLEVLGKTATTVWVGFVASLVLGVDWRDRVEAAFNSGRPIESALALALLLPTVAFLLARSAIGFARWRLQRELWRRDVERLSREGEPP